MYTCKSPHSDLGIAVLKKIIGLSIYNKLIEYEDEEEDDINVVNMSNYGLSSREEEQLTFDIIHLKSLPKLTWIYLSATGVNWDIVHLMSLLNLTYIGLGGTGVTGNIAYLKSLLNLRKIWLNETVVTGNIKDLKSLPKLTVISLENTGASGDKEAFHNYRKSSGLPYCRIIS